VHNPGDRQGKDAFFEDITHHRSRLPVLKWAAKNVKDCESHVRKEDEPLLGDISAPAGG